MQSKKSIKTIIIEHLEGNLHGDKLNELTAWVAKSNDNARYYTKVKDLWEASLADISRIAETKNEWSRFLLRIKKDYQSNIFRYNSNVQIFYRFAAILIIGLVLGGLAINYTLKQDPIFITAHAPKGSITQMVLADSTIVYLNAGSEIRYSPETVNKTREVYLKGEAWFDVTKDKKKAFVVHTSCYDVNVTGTQFNVKSYEKDNEIITTLEEGEVIISSSENFKLAENLIVTAGEQVVFNKDSNKMFVKEVNTKRFTSWKENKLMFLNLSFEELIILFERKYGVDIEVDNQEVLKYHYTGTIKNESILEILEIIKHSLPIQYKIDRQKIRISKN
jgi:transmembrane sensor